MNNIAIFASGSGTNVENIISYFSDSNKVKIQLVLSNNPDAYVIKRALNHGVAHIIFNKEDFYSSSKIVNILIDNKIDFVVLAGFLWLVPENIISHFDGKIINIHPALLPAYGGKGMYGDRVHKAVIEAKEEFSGITIHRVNAFFDDGDILFQAKVDINPSDTPEDLAQKIHALEQAHFPRVIEEAIEAL